MSSDIDPATEALVKLKGEKARPISGKVDLRPHFNPKKDRFARRQRAGYPAADDYDFKTWTIPQMPGMPPKRVTRYCATRSDGATVYRKSPSEVADSVAFAKEKKRRRDYERLQKGRAA